MEITVNDIVLHYETSGAGTPLLLLHGNGQDRHIFDKIMPKLAKHFTVYALDSRNHGQSQKTDDYSYAAMAADVYTFIQDMQLGKVNLIGFSDGAVISLLLAMHHGETVEKMALLGVNLKPSDFTEEAYEYVKATYAETNDPLFKLMLEQPNIELDAVRSVSTPTLLVAAEDDIYRPETFTALTDALPHARLQIMSGHDHGSYIMDSDILYPDLMHFFGQNDEA